MCIRADAARGVATRDRCPRGSGDRSIRAARAIVRRAAAIAVGHRRSQR